TWVDLTHQINEKSQNLPALPALEKKALFTHKDGFFVEQITVVGQYGTHLDTPIHFVEGARNLDEIYLKDLLLTIYV
ncbi:cyclase family protein, partial [Streptococcus suis]